MVTTTGLTVSATTITSVVVCSETPYSVNEVARIFIAISNAGPVTPRAAWAAAMS